MIAISYKKEPRCARIILNITQSSRTISIICKQWKTTFEFLLPPIFKCHDVTQLTVFSLEDPKVYTQSFSINLGLTTRPQSIALNVFLKINQIVWQPVAQTRESHVLAGCRGEDFLQRLLQWLRHSRQFSGQVHGWVGSEVPPQAPSDLLMSTLPQEQKPYYRQ